MNEESINRLFFGELDLHHGYNLDAQQVRKLIVELKVGSLFYDKLIIPDGYLHCIGPIAGVFNKDYNSKTLYDLELESLLKEFLERGILTPVLRGQGTSLFENWDKGKFGAVPGLGMTLDRNFEGHMERLDLLIKNPEKAPKITKTLNRDLVYSTFKKHLGHPDSPSNGTISGDLRSLYDRDPHSIKSALNMIEKLHEEVLSNRKEFRRAFVENFLIKELNRDHKELDRVRKLYHSQPGRSQRESVLFATASEILNLITTSYQLENSIAFRSSARLFDNHDRSVINKDLISEMINNPLGEFPLFTEDLIDYLNKYRSVVKSHFQILEGISIETILKIRDSDEFHELLHQKKYTFLSKEKEMWDVFMKKLVFNYVPYLIDELKKQEIIDNRKRSESHNILSFGTDSDRMIIKVLNFSLVTILSLTKFDKLIKKPSAALIDNRMTARKRKLMNYLESNYLGKRPIVQDGYQSENNYLPFE